MLPSFTVFFFLTPAAVINRRRWQDVCAGSLADCSIDFNTELPSCSCFFINDNVWVTEMDSSVPWIHLFVWIKKKKDLNGPSGLGLLRTRKSSLATWRATSEPHSTTTTEATECDGTGQNVETKRKESEEMRSPPLRGATSCRRSSARTRDFSETPRPCQQDVASRWRRQEKNTRAAENSVKNPVIERWLENRTESNELHLNGNPMSTSMTHAFQRRPIDGTRICPVHNCVFHGQWRYYGGTPNSGRVSQVQSERIHS